MSTENDSFPGNFFKFPNFLNTHPNTEAFTKIFQRNAETISEINNIVFTSFSSLITRQSELWQQETKDILKLVSSIVSAPTSIEDQAAFYAETSKVKLDKSLSNLRDIAADISTAHEKASNLLGARLREGAEEWRDVVKTRQKQVA